MEENKSTLNEEELQNQAQETESVEVATTAPEEAQADATDNGEPQEAEVVAQTEAETESKAKNEHPMPQDKQSVIERLRQIAEQGEVAERGEIEALKQAYYRFHNAEILSAREAFIAKGGEAEAFVPEADATEEAFKTELNRVKELRAQASEKEEQDRQENLKRKTEIIERIKEMTVSADVADKAYNEFKQLQAEWKEIGQVPAERATELWKTYQMLVEQFYDLLRLNNEFRAYDFKKNLEIKTRLCEAAEKLSEVEDPISAFHQLQQLHQQFRETGPVAKDLREEIWTRFKAASTLVNKRHQDHFEALKAKEEENLALKTQLCEEAEAIDVENAKTFGDWEKLTKAVLELQARWKTIGFTPRKVNTKIFERFRAACDRFFQSKAEFFKTQRETWAANLELKTKLAEEAEALKDSTEWSATTNKLIELQKRWKEIGPTAHRASEAVWRRFNEACNAFFARKNEATGDKRQEESANLERKKGILEQLEQLLNEGIEDATEQVNNLMAEWNETGHVPFRKKDAIYKRFHNVMERLRTERHFSAARRSVENFRRNVAEKGGNELERELARLKKLFEEKSAEIKNYETNLGFFSSKSSSGNALVEEMKKRIETLKLDLETVAQKIAAVREQLKGGAKPADEAGKETTPATAEAEEATPKATETETTAEE